MFHDEEVIEALKDACCDALSAFRGLYEALENGHDGETLLEEPYTHLWPLSKLRDALEVAGMDDDDIASL